MRIYGRDGAGKWQCYTDKTMPNPQAALDNMALNNTPVPDIVGKDLDQFYITLLCQNLALIKTESPAYGDYGISYKDSLAQYAFPDNDVQTVIDRFSQYFRALSVTRISENSASTITYRIDVVLRSGQSISRDVQKILRN